MSFPPYGGGGVPPENNRGYDPNDPTTWPNVPVHPKLPIHPNVPRPFDPSLNNPPGNIPLGGEGPLPPGTPAEAIAARRSALFTPPDGKSGNYPTAGTTLYDQYRINELLVGLGLNGWVATGSYTPTQLTDYKLDQDGIPVPVPSQTYVISVRGPDGSVKLLKLYKGFTDPAQEKAANEGKAATGDYQYSLANAEDVGIVDRSKQGYTGQPITIGDELWGFRADNGNFEPIKGPDGQVVKVPGALKGWQGLQQVKEADGSSRWYGIDPADGQPKVAPNMPTIPATPGYENVTPIRVGNEWVMYGWNTQKHTYEEITGIPHQKITEAPLTTPGGQVLERGPNGTWVPAQGVSQPTENATQYVVGSDSQIHRQIFRNGNWSEDNTFTPEPFGEAAKRASAAIPNKGERVALPGPDGRIVYYIADGNGGYTGIDVEKGSTALPGTPGNIIATSNDQEYIVRSDPNDPSKTVLVKNPNWTPAASADQTRQLTERAQAKQRELQAKIGQPQADGSIYTDAEANQDFETWWDTFMVPQVQYLRQNQQKEQQDQQLKVSAENRALEAQRASEYSTAMEAGQNAVANYQAQAKNMVGPTYQHYVSGIMGAIRSGTQAPDIDVKDFTYQAPDLNQLAQQATAQALQHLSPTAAAIAGNGAPQYLQNVLGGIDPSQILNRTRFMPGGQQTAPVVINVNAGQGSGGGGAAPIAGGGTTTRPASPVSSLAVPPNLWGNPFSLPAA